MIYKEKVKQTLGLLTLTTDDKNEQFHHCNAAQSNKTESKEDKENYYNSNFSTICKTRRQETKILNIKIQITELLYMIKFQYTVRNEYKNISFLYCKRRL